MDWKPKRAVQTKVKDSKKIKIKREAWRLKCVNGRILYVGLEMTTFFQTFGLIMGFLPRKCLLPHKLLLCAGLYPVCGSICLQWYHLWWSLPSVCTTMSVHLPIHLTISCLIEFTCHIVIQSYKLYILTFIHPYIIHTQHIHNIIHT